MEDMIQSADELQEYFCSFGRLSKHNFDRYMLEPVYVRTKIRADYMASIKQKEGVILKGDIYVPKFTNEGGGLYSVLLTKKFGGSDD